jgi:hypothetical protein
MKLTTLSWPSYTIRLVSFKLIKLPTRVSFQNPSPSGWATFFVIQLSTQLQNYSPVGGGARGNQAATNTEKKSSFLCDRALFEGVNGSMFSYRTLYLLQNVGKGSFWRLPLCRMCFIYYYFIKTLFTHGILIRI